MSDSVPHFEGNINFNAQHAPMGAFMSFTCGHFGSGGGIGVEIGKPANQNVYVGIKRGDRKSPHPFRCLPFVRGSTSFTAAAANFQVEQAPASMPPSVECYAEQDIRRRFGWASDIWETSNLSFSIYTPFGSIPQPTAGADDYAALRDALLPAVVATLTIDN